MDRRPQVSMEPGKSLPARFQSRRTILGLTVWLVTVASLLLHAPSTGEPEFRLHSHHQRARILLLTAHPDDEVMFFAPTVLSLRNRAHSDSHRSIHRHTSPARERERETRVSDEIPVYSLCLSSGNELGLGVVRVAELEKSLDIIGIPDKRRWVIDSPCVYGLRPPSPSG
jgi:N-acetylglucosaminylphosphatidylinositol deacetylase